MSRAPQLRTTRFLGAHMVAPMQLRTVVGLILQPSGPRSSWGIPAKDLGLVELDSMEMRRLVD